MSAFSPKQSQPLQRTPSNTTNPNVPAHSISHQQHPILNLQRTIGNQAVLRLLQAGAQPGDAVSTSDAGAVASHTGFTDNFASIPVFHTPVRGIQRKLTVNAPGDAYEQEADRVAEQVMRMPAPQSAAAHATSATSAGSAAGIQRACACGGTCDDCKKKHPENDHAHVQMKAAGPANTGGMEAPPIVHEVLRSPGQPLDKATREFMEPRFGQDFSRVRVHADEMAAESARTVQAKAYTVGHNVVFGAGAYEPGTHEGQKLLGHELAHVVQQGGHGLGVIQRREVDDRSCSGLKDIEPDIDTEVNKQIDEARKAAGTPMNTLALFQGVVSRLGAGRISPIETFIDGLGPKKVKMPPSDLIGTKYEGAEAVNKAYALQKMAPIVVAGTALVSGICAGSDKLGHFFGQGADYFDVTLRPGTTTKDAESAGRAMEIGVFGLGTGTIQPAPGVFSNADLAANLAGLKFYQDLKANPKGYKFRIKDYITPQWNEQTNPSFYESKVGGVVWSNLLRGTWEGPLVIGGKAADSRAVLNATASTVTGSYEWPIGSKSPMKATIVNGVITQRTTTVSGTEPGQAAITDTPVSGIAIEFEWKRGADSGKGRLESKDEQTLAGIWGHGKATSGGGTWKLKKK